MIWRSRDSLRWNLIWRLILLQAGMLTVVCSLIVAGLYWTGALLNFEPEDEVIGALQRAVDRDSNGGLILRTTSELARIRSKTPGMWFVIRDKDGHFLSEGVVPPEFSRIGDALDEVSQARLGWQLGDSPRSGAILRWVNASAGRVQILTGRGNRVPFHTVALAAITVIATYIGPLLILMTSAAFVATPIVVRRALQGLGAAATEAGRIDVDQRGVRLSLEQIPAEVRPLVNAINGALGRLDNGYDRQKRFLADAAHELRTPIAILCTRLESYPSTRENTRLLEDVARLSNLAEQILDLERLNQQPSPFDRVDLVALGRRAAADLAPLAIAAGYHLSFVPEADSIAVMGVQASLERAVINLIQNAIEYGGRRGTITIAVLKSGAIQVSDEGPGVPGESRERIFEPFYRLETGGRGAGLGLHLVQEIVRFHHGHIAVLDTPIGGACFRITLPLASTSARV